MVGEGALAAGAGEAALDKGLAPPLGGGEGTLNVDSFNGLACFLTVPGA